MPNKEFVRRGMAQSAARRYAARLLRDGELHAEAFVDDELTEAERQEALAELARIARALSATVTD